ncbi:MAG TPA: hypothetical protein VFV70_05685 [Hyphomonadaceae bacterium]|nr:hypothetical protein [Hyphomonadaceae bacterium]
MSNTDHIGDADVEDAVSAIMKLGPAVFDPEGQHEDKRPNREEQDVTEAETSSDLEVSEREEREKPADKDDTKQAKDGETADDGEEEFIELPGAEEGAEPVRVAVAEAVEAVQKMRQMEGDIATAIIRAETEAHDKQDKITQGMMTAFETVIANAEVALRAMNDYLPQPPDPILIDRSSGYYDPEAYHSQKLYYDAFVEHRGKIANTLKQATEGKGAVTTHADAETSKRELARAARYMPEFADEKTREAKKESWLKVLGPKYGLQKSDLDDIIDHRALRVLNDLVSSIETKKAAPEVRKHVQETKAKIVKGRVLPDRAKDGKFMGDAMKELKETGSTEAAAKLLLRSGALKGW